MFGGMADVEVCFADDRDDGRLIDLQFLGRASVKRKSRSCPTKTVSRIARRFHFRRRHAKRDMKTSIMNFTKNLGVLVLAIT